MVKSLPPRHVYFNVRKQNKKHNKSSLLLFTLHLYYLEKLFVLYILKTLHSVQEVIRQDYQQIKECKLTMLMSTGSHPASWGAAKKSPHLEIFNQGLSINLSFPHIHILNTLGKVKREREL